MEESEQKELLSDMKRSADEFLLISHNEKTFIPNFVNMAFACELYLKVIQQKYRGKYSRDHNLETLYNEAIEYIKEADFLVLLNEEIEKVFPDRGIDNAKRDLCEMFQKHKTLFEDWRYIFEPKKDDEETIETEDDEDIIETEDDGEIMPHEVDMVLLHFANSLKRFTDAMGV